jgi:hypothetical protein
MTCYVGLVCVTAHLLLLASTCEHRLLRSITEVDWIVTSMTLVLVVNPEKNRQVPHLGPLSSSAG